jgi:hypothetical protein
MLAGMTAGTGVLAWIWWTGALAWTWYALAGAAVTWAVALLFSAAGRGPDARPL